MSTKSLRLKSYVVRPPEQVLPASLARRPIMAAPQLGSDAAAIRRRTMRVGFIGIDLTGMTMVLKLIKAGHQLAVYDPGREIPEALTSAGASMVNNIQDACRSADAVFTMLPDDEAAEAVMLGSGGVVESLPRDAIHIGSSTVSVDCSDRIVEEHWNAGKQYVSAPVLVTSEPRGKQHVLVIAGGREATIIQIESLLSQIGQLAQISGWPSDANVVQLGADPAGPTLSQFLARHPELCTRPRLSQFARLATPLDRILDFETKGVLQ